VQGSQVPWQTSPDPQTHPAWGAQRDSAFSVSQDSHAPVQAAGGRVQPSSQVAKERPAQGVGIPSQGPAGSQEQ